MTPLTIVKIGGTVGGSQAKNDAADVKIVQGLLNDAIEFGDPALLAQKALTVNGKVDAAMLTMIQQYQRFKGLGPAAKLDDVVIDPGKGTMKHLSENPFVDVRWSTWDAAIKTEVSAYNTKFASSSGYTALDWRLIKAQVWTEVLAGPDSSDWWSRPLQIGKFSTDKGLQVIRDGLDHSELVTDKKLRDDLAKDTTGANNIRAGVAYDVHLCANYSRVEVIDDPTVKIHEVAKHDTLETIAKAEKTTVHNLETQNGLTASSTLSLGQKLKFQLAHWQWQISGWDPWLDAIEKYNGGGDPNYRTKINAKLAKVKKRW